MLALAPAWGCTLACVGAEQRLGPLAGDVLDLVDDLVAAVVALAGVALAVLVGEHRAGGAQHRRRGEVLAGDQLDGGVLALDLAVDEAEDLVVRVAGPDGHGLASSASMSAIWATRRSWRPPSNGRGEPELEDLVGQARRRRCGRPWPARWRRCARGSGGPCRGRCRARPARPWTLLAAICSPWPRAAEHDAAVGLAGDDRPADGRADRRVVDRLGAVGAEVERPRGRGARAPSTRCAFRSHAGVVGSDGDLHACCPSARVRAGKARSTTVAEQVGRAGRR